MFTRDWFSNNLERWERLVAPHLTANSSGKPIVALELGAHEGRSARWLLENVLAHRPGSRLFVVDTFADPAVRARFDRNVTRAFPGMVTVIKGVALALLRSSPQLRALEGRADFIYVDAIGGAREYLEAAVACFPLLRPRGMIVFDDYTHDRMHGTACPRRGVDAFLDLYAPLLKVRELSWQAIAIRRARPLPVPRCRSEYFHEDVRSV